MNESCYSCGAPLVIIKGVKIISYDKTTNTDLLIPVYEGDTEGSPCHFELNEQTMTINFSA